MRLLLSSDHAELALEAKDRSKRRLFITSHRFGIAGKPMVLLPAITAANESKVETSVYYGRTTGALSGMAAADLTRDLAHQGIQIRPVHRPRLHAKVLGWDDDALAVTSLNWLSADPPEDQPLREIGVFVEASRIADNFVRRFEVARVAAQKD
jgi:cardiolipin synthase